MSTQILDLINDLSLSEKAALIEILARDIQKVTTGKSDTDEEMKKAADLLLADYETNSELTAFTALDSEDFYETK